MLRYFVSFFFLIFSLYSLAQGPETIVVRAERVPLEEMMNKVRADRTITSQEMSAKGYDFLPQLLSEEAGIHVVQSGPRGGQTSVFLHGLKSEYVLVLVDGVIMNDPSSPGRSYDFSHLSLLNIDRIEIVKGPDSIHYGSDAMSGVIKIWTKPGAKSWSSIVRGEGGSFGTSGVQVETRGPLPRNFSLNLAGEHYNTRGFSAASSHYPGNVEDDGFNRQSAQAKIEGRPEGLVHLILGGKWARSKTDLDQGGGDYQDDLNYSLKQEDRSYFFELDKAISDFWAPALKVKSANHTKIANDEKDSPADLNSFFEHYRGNNRVISLQNTSLLSDDSKFMTGLESARESMEIKGIMPERSVRSEGIFLSFDHKWNRSHFLLGVRNDHHEIFGDFQSYSVGPSYTFIMLPMSVSAAWSSGFKAPSLYQLYSQYGRTSLGPEKAKTLQIKNLMTVALWELEIELFQTKVEDLIDFDFVSSQYSNQGIFKTKGGDLALRGPISHSFKGEMSYSYTISHDQTGQEALRRPTHEMHGQVVYTSEKWQGRLSGNFVGRREDVHSTNFSRVSMSSYFLLNTSMAYNIKKNLRTDLRVDNIWDKDYEEIHGHGTAGRSYFVGLSYEL